MERKNVITALEVQKRNKERVNVFVDGEYAFSLTLIEAARLHKGQTLSEAEIAVLRDEDAIIEATNKALRFLAYRPRSIQEVRRNLAQKSLPPAVIEAALDRLSAMGYLNDQTFARYWVENRETFKPLGPAALRYELRHKGVANDVIDEVLSEALDVEAAAYRAATNEARRLRGRSRREFHTKLANLLKRRGFAYSTGRSVIHRLIEELETDDPEFFAPGEE
jgi:regulatory protein